LPVFREAAVGSVEDEIVLVDARSEGLRSESLEGAKKRFGVENTELNFGFARHGRKRRISDISDQRSDRRRMGVR